ncbi:hypothetical protein TKK_0008917 [Trichogramma kaykai]|uniref:APCDD1 domain-containing protein n=1 Tax=Trichogramma kaykai TaxID=54128 RepID=A0ABD2X346_9HYME
MTSIYLVLAILVLGCSGLARSQWDASEQAIGEDQCDLAVREIVKEDRATSVDESPTRLHSTWISQECESRTGPEFVIRKYTFFENGTFLLMRHYYAEESCSIATHSVTARGHIKILGSSLVTPGATEARYQLDSVHVSPLNRQVAHKLSHRVNVSCGPQPRWRPYTAQLIYERAPGRFGPAGSSHTWQASSYNSLQGHHAGLGGSAARLGKSVDCLAPLGIDFEELRLLRVQRRPTGFRSLNLGLNDKPRIELFFGSLPPDHASKRTHRPTSLQPAPLLRIDTIHNCPICGAIARGTENSPPLLHETVALPALLGGSWISPSCESHSGGLWLRRQLRVYAGDKLWTGRWDYFSDPRCSNYLYGITAAGSYVQRARRHRRHDLSSREQQQLDAFDEQRSKRSVDEVDYYRHLLQTAQPSMAESFAAMLRGNQRREETTAASTRPKPSSPAPTGTTELDLHVAESLLIAGDGALARRCGAVLALDGQTPKSQRLSSWPSSCVPHSLDAPSTLGLRARISVDWYGQYTLVLGSRERTMWEAPLIQCGPTSMKNPLLRSHLRRSVGLRFGLLFSNSGNNLPSNSFLLLLSHLALLCLGVVAVR